MPGSARQAERRPRSGRRSTRDPLNPIDLSPVIENSHRPSFLVGVHAMSVYLWRWRSTYSSIIAPIESIDSLVEDAERAGWEVKATMWSDADDAWKVLLKRKR